MYKMVASEFSNSVASEFSNSVHVFSYQCAYWFILIFLLAISMTRLMNKILLNYFTIKFIE